MRILLRLLRRHWWLTQCAVAVRLLVGEGFGHRSSGRYGHLAQLCYYHFDREYGGSFAPNTALASSSRPGQGPHEAFFGESSWWSSIRGGPVLFGRSGQCVSPLAVALVVFPSSHLWEHMLPNYSMPNFKSIKVSNLFIFPSTDAGHVVGSAPSKPRDLTPFMSHPFGPYDIGHQVGHHAGPKCGSFFWTACVWAIK